MYNLAINLLQKKKLKKKLSSGEPAKLHIGCGADYLDGYINIDASRKAKADLYLQAYDLKIIDADAVDQIESYHLFEHLEFYDAQRALREWFRVIRPDGLLVLELPNLDVCIREIGKHHDDNGIDLALVGIYGFPPHVARDGFPQIHKWGWNPISLSNALKEVGFVDICEHSIRQNYRPAAAFGRDMQIRARVPKTK